MATSLATTSFPASGAAAAGHASGQGFAVASALGEGEAEDPRGGLEFGRVVGAITRRSTRVGPDVVLDLLQKKVPVKNAAA